MKRKRIIRTFQEMERDEERFNNRMLLFIFMLFFITWVLVKIV